MTTPTPAGSAGNNASLNARLLIKTLCERFPVFKDASPLAIGIDKQLQASLPGLDRKTLRIALGMHTNSLRYLKSMEKATQRLNLDGTAGDDVSETHRGHAAQVLRERFRKDAERRQALKAAQEAEAFERERVEKLSRLVEKFAKKK